MSTNESLEKVRDAWQPFYEDRKLTLDDARNISTRLSVFFQMLMEVDKKTV